jgi:hypothetical protein
MERVEPPVTSRSSRRSGLKKPATPLPHVDPWKAIREVPDLENLQPTNSQTNGYAAQHKRKSLSPGRSRSPSRPGSPPATPPRSGGTPLIHYAARSAPVLTLSSAPNVPASVAPEDGQIQMQPHLLHLSDPPRRHNVPRPFVVPQVEAQAPPPSESAEPQQPREQEEEAATALVMRRPAARRQCEYAAPASVVAAAATASTAVADSSGVGERGKEVEQESGADAMASGGGEQVQQWEAIGGAAPFEEVMANDEGEEAAATLEEVEATCELPTRPEMISLERTDFRQLVIALRNLRAQRDADLGSMRALRDALQELSRLALHEAPGSTAIAGLVRSLRSDGLLRPTASGLVPQSHNNS